MSNSYTRNQRNARKGERLTFLRAHALLPLLPGANQDVDVHASTALGLVADGMVESGLYSKTTEHKAMRWGIRLLVSEIRGEHVSGKDQRYKS